MSKAPTRFARLFRGLRDRLFLFTATTAGELLSLSEGGWRLGNRASEKSTRVHWRDLADWTPESLRTLADVFSAFATGEQEHAELELAYRHPDGRLHHLEIQAFRVQDRAGDEPVIEGMAQDISERKAREAHRHTLQRAIEQAPVSILITDAEARIVYVNPFFCQISGYRAEEVIGQTPRLFKSGEHDDQTYRALWQSLSRGETWRGELLNKGRDGRLYWESASISPIRDEQGRTTHYLGVKEDIGDRKELERMKDDVERIMHHDLKNPLNVILALPELLLLDDNLTAEQRDSLVMLLDAGRKMREMIDLSLDLFKMETGQFEYVANTINLIPILDQVARQAESRGQARGVTLKFRLDGGESDSHLESHLGSDAGLLVRGDARLLFSMLANLTANAVDASPHGACVIVELWRENPLRLGIVNRGAVPVAIRRHFFEKYRTHGKRGGTGLGTYSAKLMADTMGMELRMETLDATDSTRIHLVLPAAAPRAASRPYTA